MTECGGAILAGLAAVFNDYMKIRPHPCERTKGRRRAGIPKGIPALFICRGAASVFFQHDRELVLLRIHKHDHVFERLGLGERDALVDQKRRADGEIQQL